LYNEQACDQHTLLLTDRTSTLSAKFCTAVSSEVVLVKYKPTF